MATSVNTAFSEFLADYVSLAKSHSDKAKDSREFLKDSIHDFSGKDGFYKLCSKYDCYFGSFSRKTKIRPLDDIDIIIGLNGSNTSFTYYAWNDIRMKVTDTNDPLYYSTDAVSTYGYSSNSYGGSLNSNKVKNKFKKMLEGVPQYYKAEIKSTGAAVTLELLSYDWVFDIVPAFYSENCGGRAGYLIPNGNGHWQLTDPRIEQARASTANQKFNNVVLPTIRLVKYWNRRGQMPNITSYVLETIVLDYFDQASHSVVSDGKYYDYPDMHFRDALSYIANHITSTVQDSKGIQGNINNLTWEQKAKIQTRARNDYTKANEAVIAETRDKDNKKSINLWRDIFGGDFPTYG